MSEWDATRERYRRNAINKICAANCLLNEARINMDLLRECSDDDPDSIEVIRLIDDKVAGAEADLTITAGILNTRLAR